MKNYVQPGENLTVTLSGTVSSGDGVLVGSIFGIAQEDGVSGDAITIIRRGVFDLAKTSAQAWAVGDPVFWDAGNSECTTVVTDNTLIGYAVADAADPSDTGHVLLTGEIHPQAAFVADASAGSAVEINAIRDTLVAVGIMAAS
ncbi:MAG: DUF2190 family protein [Marinibacterium sp.]